MIEARLNRLMQKLKGLSKLVLNVDCVLGPSYFHFLPVDIEL